MSQSHKKEPMSESTFFLDIPNQAPAPHSLFNDPWLHKILILIGWMVGLSIFFLLQFGLVYVTISGIVLIFLNTRTKLKLPGELSAYSVFNPQQQRIQGTFDDKDMLPLVLVSY